MPNTPPKSPEYKGSRWRGLVCTRIIIAPENIPDEPSPEIARPMIRAVEFGAAPHSVDPASKMPMASKKTYLTE
jgi:hypothetical protein